MLVILGLKELFFVTYFLAWIVLCAVGAILMLLLAAITAVGGAILGPLYVTVSGMSGGWIHEHCVKALNTLREYCIRERVPEDAKNAVLRQASIIAHMCLHISIMYRLLQLIYQLRRGRISSSLQDGDTKLTDMSNVLFTLVMILMESQHAAPQ